MTVENLSIVFPGLDDIFTDKAKILNFDLNILLDNETLREREGNLFAYTDINIKLSDGSDFVCEMTLKNQINLYAISSTVKHNLLYLN